MTSQVFKESCCKNQMATRHRRVLTGRGTGTQQTRSSEGRDKRRRTHDTHGVRRSDNQPQVDEDDLNTTFVFPENESFSEVLQHLFLNESFSDVVPAQNESFRTQFHVHTSLHSCSCCRRRRRRGSFVVVVVIVVVVVVCNA